jgi:hypothetical protein
VLKTLLTLLKSLIKKAWAAIRCTEIDKKNVKGSTGILRSKLYKNRWSTPKVVDSLGGDQTSFSLLCSPPLQYSSLQYSLYNLFIPFGLDCVYFVKNICKSFYFRVIPRTNCIFFCGNTTSTVRRFDKRATFCA